MTFSLRPAGFSAPSHCVFNFLKLGAALGLFFWFAAAACGAVDATLTPSTTSSNSVTPVVLQVTGLSNGESVIVERYVDANANGDVDAGEFLAETFTVTDGQVNSIGGVRNTNIPGDEDPTAAADGQMSINLHPALGPELGRVAGSHIVRISGTFGALIRTLTLTNPAQEQFISGTVTDGAIPVPYASVILLDAATEDDFTLGVIANASGVYTAPAPVGSYKVLPFKNGYIANFPTPTVLAAAATPTQNLVLTAATTSISGKVADVGTNAGLGGVQLFFASTLGDLVTIISTSADGTYSVPVTAGQWNVETSEISLALLGYLSPSNQGAGNTATAPATGVNINFTKATALIHGMVADASPTSLAGIRVNASDSNNTYYCEATTDANGHYVLGVTTGSWNVNISNQSPGLAGYIVPNSQSATISGAQAVQKDFTMSAVNAHLKGTVTNADTSLPISAITIGAYNQITSQFISVQTAVDGTFDLGLVAGTWMVQLNSQSAATANLVSSSVNYTLAVDQTISGITFQVKSSTAQITGLVLDGDNSNQPISNANVYATATISTVLYNANAQTDNNGSYSLPVVNGTWQVGAFASGYTNTNSVTETVSGPNVTRDFTLTKGPVIAIHPNDHTATAGQTFVFSVNVNGNAVTYQWQVSTDNGSNWADLTNDSTYSTVTSNVLNVTSAIGLNGYRYRCIATNGFGSATSNSALLTVNAANVAPSFSLHPSNQTVTAGQNATFNVSASGTPSPTFQWQESIDSGSTWNNLAEGSAYSGTTSSSLTVTATIIGQNGHRYRAMASNTAGSVSSNVAILTVDPVSVAPAITAHPSNQTVTAGLNASFSVSASGTPSPTFQWQVSTDSGIIWNNLADDASYSGTGTGILQVTAATIGQNGNLYRAVATNGAGSANSNSALLTVNAANVAPNFTANPSNQTVTAGQNAIFSASANGTPAPTFQWQVSTDSGVIWNNLADDATYSGVTTTSLTVTGTTTGQNSYQYRAVATNVAGSANSNSALLTVNAANVAPSITTNPANQSVTAGQNASFTVAADGTPAPTFQWEVSTNGGSNWSSLNDDSTYSGVTTTTLTITGTIIGQNGYLYRAVATNVAGTATSNSVMLTVGAQNYAILHNFIYGSDGGSPVATLIQSGTTLYGTTISGGSSGYGTVFKINTDGTGYTVLHNFNLGTNGGYPGGAPHGKLVLSGSTLYGTTVNGGWSGYGTVFKVNTDGTGFTTLYDCTFAEANPSGGLALAGGILYGTANGGSGPGYGGSSFGTVFAINTDGTGFTTLHSFTTPTGSYPNYINTDGVYPRADLMVSGGVVYGTTVLGGSSASGTVFAINTNGSGFTTLHNFSAISEINGTNSDGGKPTGGLILSGSTLYGTTQAGGASQVGTVFKVETNGTNFTALHSFDWTNDGGQPRAGLTISGGTLFGTAMNGGTYGHGTVYSVNTDGTGFMALHTFAGGATGQTPESGLILWGSKLYGASGGGSGGNGTVFSLTITPPSASFISWAQTYFTPGELLDANVSGPNAILGVDGLTNLVKYALGLDPTIDATAGLPEVSTIATDWVYTYTRPVDRTDITYAVEVSTNLTTWGAPATAAVLISTVGNVETWQAKHPLASAPNAFFRLKVTQL
jgi:uncharacterized repeat protein (TIGR03803 family)